MNCRQRRASPGRRNAPSTPAIRALVGRRRAVASAGSPDAAVYATEELEQTAKLFLLLKGQEVRPLDEEQIRELGEVFRLET